MTISNHEIIISHSCNITLNFGTVVQLDGDWVVGRPAVEPGHILLNLMRVLLFLGKFLLVGLLRRAREGNKINYQQHKHRCESLFHRGYLSPAREQVSSKSSRRISQRRRPGN